MRALMLLNRCPVFPIAQPPSVDLEDVTESDPPFRVVSNGQQVGPEGHLRARVPDEPLRVVLLGDDRRHVTLVRGDVLSGAPEQKLARIAPLVGCWAIAAASIRAPAAIASAGTWRTGSLPGVA